MINTGNALYAHRDVTIEICGSKIGKAGIAGLKTSIHRMGVSGSPKISSAALIFDLIFKYPGTIAAYIADGEKAYVEIGEVKAVVTQDTIRYSEEAKNPSFSKFLLIPYVLYEYICGINTEFIEAFNGCIEEYRDKGTIMESSIMLLCDSFYYGSVKDIKEIDDSYDLEDAEIEAAFRSGLCQESVLYSSDSKKYLKRSAYEKGKPSKSKKKKTADRQADFISECKAGKYHVAYEWPEHMKKYIINPRFLDTFEVTPEFEEIVRKIKFKTDRILERMDMGLTGAEAIGKDAMNIMLIGKPGTGKTTLCYGISAATGMPVGTTVHTKHTEEDEYEGKTKIVDGKQSFVETDSLIFHENGGIDICEEINLTDPSVTMGGLGQKLEYPYIIKKNGYESIVRHPLNIVFATKNLYRCH